MTVGVEPAASPPRESVWRTSVPRVLAASVLGFVLAPTVVWWATEFTWLADPTQYDGDPPIRGDNAFGLVFYLLGWNLLLSAPAVLAWLFLHGRGRRGWGWALLVGVLMVLPPLAVVGYAALQLPYDGMPDDPLRQQRLLGQMAMFAVLGPLNAWLVWRIAYWKQRPAEGGQLQPPADNASSNLRA